MTVFAPMCLFGSNPRLSHARASTLQLEPCRQGRGHGCGLQRGCQQWKPKPAPLCFHGVDSTANPSPLVSSFWHYGGGDPGNLHRNTSALHQEKGLFHYSGLCRCLVTKNLNYCRRKILNLFSSYSQTMNCWKKKQKKEKQPYKKPN